MRKLGLIIGSLLAVNLAKAEDVMVMAPLPPPRPFFVAPALTAYANIYEKLRTNTLWTREGVLAPEVSQLRAVLMDTRKHGLPSIYWTQELENRVQNFQPEQAEAFEVAATKALVNYARDLSNGRVDPESVGAEIKVSRKSVPFNQIVMALQNTTGDLKSNLELLAPQWPVYRQLQNLLARLNAITPEQWGTIKNPGKSWKLGNKHPIFEQVKRRLALMGYPVSEFSQEYTKELLAVVQTYFTAQTIPGTPGLNSDSAIWAHMAVGLEARVQQVLLSMEKVRWMPTMPGERYAYVNLGLQRLRVFEGNSVVLEMKTINGRSKRKSPMLADKITMVELNPDWTVPPRLIAEDKAPAMQKDPYFLDRGHYDLFDNRGRRMDPWEVDWRSITKESAQNIQIKQSPGLGNALGIMKFHLTNPYAIYLHDTNERNLFTQNHRLLSSGCIRLERPLDLSTYVLKNHPKWGNPQTVSDNLSEAQVIEPWIKAKNQITVQEPLPVYLMSITAEGDSTGAMKFANDYYGQDKRLYDALRGRLYVLIQEDFGE